MTIAIKGLNRKVIFKINSYDFDNMIHQYLGDFIKSDKIKEYEFVPYEECSNDDVKSFNIKHVFDSVKRDPDYFEYYIEQWKIGKFHWTAGMMLEYLVFKGILEEGEYLVTVGS